MFVINDSKVLIWLRCLLPVLISRLVHVHLVLVKSFATGCVSSVMAVNANGEVIAPTIIVCQAVRWDSPSRQAHLHTGAFNLYSFITVNHFAPIIIANLIKIQFSLLLSEPYQSLGI